MGERRYEKYKGGKKVDLSFRCYKKYLQLGKMIITVLLLNQKTTVANQPAPGYRSLRINLGFCVQNGTVPL